MRISYKKTEERLAWTLGRAAAGLLVNSLTLVNPFWYSLTLGSLRFILLTRRSIHKISTLSWFLYLAYMRIGSILRESSWGGKIPCLMHNLPTICGRFWGPGRGVVHPLLYTTLNYLVSIMSTRAKNNIWFNWRRQNKNIRTEFFVTYNKCELNWKRSSSRKFKGTGNEGCSLSHTSITISVQSI